MHIEFGHRFQYFGVFAFDLFLNGACFLGDSTAWFPIYHVVEESQHSFVPAAIALNLEHHQVARSVDIFI